MKNYLLLAVLVVNSILVSHASMTTAIMPGDWSETTTWSNGVPGCFDTIVIPAGFQVDITTTTDLESCPDSIVVLVSGTLNFQNGKKLKLPCLSDVIVFPGGSVGVGSGGGSSTYIEICNTQYWNASSGDLTGPSNLCDGGCPPAVFLPIDLLYFTADMREDGEGIDLSWIILSELNNDYFTIERSSDGQIWEEIGEVEGAGNSSERLDYSFTDWRPVPNVIYYRLKQTDYDGEFKYAPPVQIESVMADELLVYPNPTTSGESIVVLLPDNSVNKDVMINIFSMDGKLVYSRVFNSLQSRQVIMPTDYYFEKGIYLIQTDFGAQRLIIQ